MFFYISFSLLEEEEEESLFLPPDEYQGKSLC